MKQVNPSLHLQNGSATKEHDLPCTIQQLRGGVCEDLRWPDDVLAEMGQISPNQFISWELRFCLNTGYKHYKHITHKHYNLEMLPQGHVSIENKDAHNTNIKIEEGNCYRLKWRNDYSHTLRHHFYLWKTVFSSHSEDGKPLFTSYWGHGKLQCCMKKELCLVFVSKAHSHRLPHSCFLFHDGLFCTYLWHI